MKYHILIFLVLSFYWYPAFFTFADEGEYVHSAVLLSRGIFPPITDPLQSYKYNTQDQVHFYPQYPLGMGLFFAIIVKMVPWQLLFFVPLLLHLASFLVLYKILHQLRLNPSFALLFLYHPGMVFFSRTLMSEPLTIFLVLTAFYYYIRGTRKGGMIAGFLLGLSLIVRYVSGIFFLVLFCISWFENRDRAKGLLAGFLPFLILLLLLNGWIYGPKLMGYRTEQFTGKPQFFGLLERVMLLGKYALPLLIIYPGLLLTVIWYKGPFRKEIRTLLIAHFVWFFVTSAQTFHYDLIKNLVIGPRYLLPLYGLLLIPYASFLHQWKKIITLGSIGLLFIAAGVMAKQYDFTVANRGIMETIYQHTPEHAIIYGNSYVLFFASSLFGERYAIKVYPQRPTEAFRYEYIQQYKEKYPQYGIVLSRSLDGESLTGVENEEDRFLSYPHKIILNQTDKQEKVIIIQLFPDNVKSK